MSKSHQSAPEKVVAAGSPACVKRNVEPRDIEFYLKPSFTPEDESEGFVSLR